MAANGEMNVSIGGFGAIGMAVARALDGRSIPGMRLAAVSANDKPAATARMKDYASPVPVMGLAELADTSDIVIECAPSAVFREVAEAAIEKGLIFMPLCGLGITRLLSASKLVSIPYMVADPFWLVTLILTATPTANANSAPTSCR